MPVDKTVHLTLDTSGPARAMLEAIRLVLEKHGVDKDTIDAAVADFPAAFKERQAAPENAAVVTKN